MAPSSTKIEFYILENTSAQKSLHFTCQLIEKIHQEQQHIYVHTASRGEAERVDTLLWTYRDDSFLPHHLHDENDELPSPIQIGYQEKPQHHQDVLINLHRDVPEFYQQFTHVIEIIFADPVMQQLARERYRYYRDQGCEINTHKLKDAPF